MKCPKCGSEDLRPIVLMPEVVKCRRCGTHTDTSNVAT